MAVIDQLKHGPTEFGPLEHGVALGPLLERFAKKGRELPEIPLNLTLINRRPAFLSVDVAIDIYGLNVMDARTHFMLIYEAANGAQIGLTNIGFDLDWLGHSVLIKQLQAARFGALQARPGGFQVPGDHSVQEQRQIADNAISVISGIRWEKMMVQIVLDWAARNGFTAVKIRQAKHNFWYREGTARAERMKMHYDVTAQRMGFRKPRWYSKYWTKRVRTA